MPIVRDWVKEEKEDGTPWWQYPLMPFQWFQEHVAEPFGAIVTSPWSPSVSGTEGMGWLEREMAEYKQWESPWGVKGFVETLPWLAIPSGTGVAARLGGAGAKLAEVAARGGVVGKIAEVGAKVTGGGVKALKPAVAVETGIAKGVSTITNPVLKKLGNLMAQTRIARKATKALRKVELSKRVAAAQATFDKVLAETRDPDLALRMSKAQLKGEMPISTKALGEALTKEEATGLKLQIADHPTLTYFEKLRSQTALDKFLTTEELLQPAELKLLERVFPGVTTLNALKIKMGSNAWLQFVDVANLPRAMLASTDLSYTLRQGGILLARFPSELKGVMQSQFKTLFSQKNWQAIMTELERDPDWGLWALHGGYAAPEPGALTTIGAREEFFASRWAEKVIPTVKPSERAFTIAGNYLRFKSFKNYLNIARRVGMTDDATLDGLVKLVNWASGRGKIPAFLSARGGAGAGFINAFLFAPRYVFSRLELPTLLFHPSPLVRKEAARLLVQFLGAGTAILSLAKLAGADIELDPRSSDFGKIRMGNTRLDIWTGYVQWVRFGAQVTTGTSKIVGTGEIAKRNRLNIAWNLVQSKESPFASILTDLLKGETYLGEPIWRGWDTIKERLTPLFIQDVLDAIEADSLGMGAGVAIPSLLGVGAVSYKPTQTTQMGLPKLPELELPSLP